MTDLEALDQLIAARSPLVTVETAEAPRVDALFQRAAVRCGRPLYRWTLALGLQRLDQEQRPDLNYRDPSKLLAMILSMPQPGLYLLHDLQRALNDPLTVSQLREIATRQVETPHLLALVAPAIALPAELRSLASRLELLPPTAAELEALVHEEAADWGARHQKRVQATAESIAALVRNLGGLGMADARRLIRIAIGDDGQIDEADLPALMTAKHQLLDQSGVLSFETATAKLADVAGLANLKRWLEQRRGVFLANTPLPGLDAPKGLLLLGVQGGGKSLAAKAVAGAWGLPLLRLDFAALYNKYYGETERNLRDSLKTAAQMQPCVLWIDEIEKGLASDGEDGGPGKRILGTLLTWMSERKDKVFLVATANDIEALPPELLRKGRFDEIFFVDLPKAEARQAIFAIHLKKRGADPGSFDLPSLATASEGFSGAEIEQSVIAGLYAAHSHSEPLSTAHVQAELQATRPLSVVMAEKVAYLRAWAAQRTVPAD